MDCSPPGSSVHGIFFFRQEYWNGLPFPILGDLPKPGIKPTPPVSPALSVDSSPPEPSVKLLKIVPDRMAIIQKSKNNNCWRMFEGKGTLLLCWWECKLIQPLWRTIWRFLNDNPICKTEKETQMYRTDFWTLWEKARVGCFERTALKHVYYLG